MNKMTIGAAFSETFAFVRANWLQMLMWVGGTVIVLAVLAYLTIGSTFAAMMMAPNDPAAAMGAFSRIFLFALLASVLLYAVGMLIWRGGLYPGEAPNFGWALVAGPAFALAMIVVMVAAYIAMILVSLVLALIFGAALGGAGAFSADALQSGALGGGAIALLMLYYLVVLVAFLWLQGRLSVAGPVMAERLTRNPVTGLAESWKMTGASQWSIVGFYVLFVIGLSVYMFLAGMIFGGLAGVMGAGLGAEAMLMMVVFGVVVYLPTLLLSLAMPVGIYRALGTQTSGDVFA